MRSGSWFGLALLISVLLAGCAPKPSQPSKPSQASRASQASQDDLVVIFDGTANIFDQGVYRNGARIGQIQSIKMGPGNVTKASIRLSSKALQALGNSVFYLTMGRLEAVRLQGAGTYRSKGGPLCGFTSKTQLSWFKFKTLLSDRITAARMRAMALQARSR